MKSTKPRRYKVECISCGAVFNNDYQRFHENKKHNGKNIRVKVVGAPENPFAASTSKKRKINSDDALIEEEASINKIDKLASPSIPNSLDELLEHDTIIDVQVLENRSTILSDDRKIETEEEVKDYQVRLNDTVKSKEMAFSDIESMKNESLVTPLLCEQTSNLNIPDPSSIKFEECVGSFASLFDKIATCKNILDEVKENTIVNSHSTVLKIINSVEFIKNACEYTFNICNQFDKAVEERNKTISINDDPNQTFKMVSHDPGLREKLNTDNERRYLISLGPHQPILNQFPSDGKNRFNPKWYRQYNFLEYSTVKDTVFCFACFIFPDGAGKEKAETAWSTDGVTGWGKMKSTGKNEKGKLDKHFSSNAHKCALNDYAHFLNKEGHVDSLLDRNIRNAQIEEERIKIYNKKSIEILLDISKTLGRQGLAFRGTEDDQDGNFRQIVFLVARHSTILKYWIDNVKFRPYHISYFSNRSQNEFITLIGNEVRREISNEISECKFITVMADTTPDASNKDILSVVVRSVDKDGYPKERLIDVVVAQDKTGLGIATAIFQSLTNMNINTKKLAFQSYDFAASMSGQFNGTQKHISDLVGHHVPFVACQAHRTNTAVEHSCNVSKIAGNLFDTLEELYVFFSSSTKRFQLFKDKITEIETALQLKNLSKTRWTARAESVDAVNKSLEMIVDLLLEMSNSKQSDAKTKTKAYGLYKKILTFDFIVALVFMKPILFKSKILTKLLESTDLNVVDVITCIKSTIISLGLIRNSATEIDDLIESAKIFARKLNIDCENDFNKHHRRRVAPKRLDENQHIQVVHNLNSFYRQEFLLILDTLSNLLSSNVQSCINSLKPCFQIFAFPLNRQNLKNENIVALLEMFPDQKNVPNVDALQAELEILFDNCKSATKIEDILVQSRNMKWLKLAFEVLQFVMTAGYSVATNERKFSILKLIKNDIRSRMGDDRLRDLLITKSEVDITDNINLESAINVWSELKNRRICLNK